MSPPMPALGAARRPRPVPGRGRGAAAPRAGGPAGRRRRPGRPDRARGRVDGVVRGARASASAPGCRCGWPPASARTRCSCRSTRRRTTRRRSEVMATLRSLEWGGVPVVLEVLGLGRGVPRAAGAGHGELGDPRAFADADPRRGARGHRAALLGRHRRQQAAGQDRHRLRQAARGLAADGRQLVRGDGRPADHGAVGDRHARPARGWPRSASTPSTSSPPPTPGCWPPSSVRRWGRGTTGSAGARTRARSTRRRGCRGRTAARRPSRPTSRTGTRWPRPYAGDHPAGGRRHRPRGPAGGAGRPQDPAQAVHHRQPQPHPARADQRPRGARRGGGLAARPGRARPRRSGCSAYAWRWCRPRAATER